LVGVVGDDRAGEDVLAQARRDGIDVSCVLQRPGARTSLLVDVVTGDGERRLLEDTPPQVLLTAEDVAAAAHLVRTADTVVVQAQQTGEAVLAALRLAHEHGARTVLDGAPDARVVPQALSLTDVLRADEQEAGLLCDRDLTGPGEFISAARQLLAAGPSLVVLAAGRAGNVVAWTGGERLVPLTDATVVDRTGAGDVAVAALVVALQDGRAPADAAEYAAAAQADTVQRLGGRPRLSQGGPATGHAE
jgi:ribokinase